MYNPFETIETRLSKIENLILDLKHQSVKIEKTPQREHLLNIDEAAEFLDLSKATIYSKVSRGELPFMKQSKRLYFSSTELMDYLKEGRRKSVEQLQQEAEAHLANIKKGSNYGK